MAVAAVLVAAGVSRTPIQTLHATGGRPPMGWSSWSSLRHHPTAAGIEAQAQALKTSGLAAAGYRYVNVDDYWMACNSHGPEVDRYGRWIPEHAAFPSGIAAVARYVHALGLKFGLYVTPGIPASAVRENTTIQGTHDTAIQIAEPSVTEQNYDCGHMYGINYAGPGAQAYIDSWAMEFASWGVDYVKLDGVGNWDIPDIRAWSAALRRTGRPITLELSNTLAFSDAALWPALADGWRTGNDIECYSCEKNGSSFPLTDWREVASRFDAVASWQPFGGQAGWNDEDSVEIGNGARDGLTVPERQTVLSSPSSGCRHPTPTTAACLPFSPISAHSSQVGEYRPDDLAAPGQQFSIPQRLTPTAAVLGTGTSIVRTVGFLTSAKPARAARGAAW